MLIKRHDSFILFSPRCYLSFSLIKTYFITIIWVKFKLKRGIISLLYIRYLKVKQSNNWILQFCHYYVYIAENSNTWSVNIKQKLQSSGLGQMWDELILDLKSAYKIIEKRIYDTEKQNILAQFWNSNKRVLYQHLIDNICLQHYLTKPCI